MKHARADYDPIQDPRGLIPDDEPVMLFRAQDENFGDVCMFYAARLESKGGDPEMIRRVRAHAKLGAAWPNKKKPDLASNS